MFQLFRWRTVHLDHLEIAVTGELAHVKALGSTMNDFPLRKVCY